MKQTENTEMVQTRLSPSDKARMQRAAKRRGLTDAAYVRGLILKDIEASREKIAGPEVLG